MRSLVKLASNHNTRLISTFFCFFVSLYAADETPHRSGQFWISSMNWEVTRSSSRPSAILLCVTQSTWIARVVWLVDNHQQPTFVNCSHVKYETRKVGENRDKFYLSPTVCQCVCRLFLCRSHAPTWVCQHEFANFSLPCEGRFIYDQIEAGLFTVSIKFTNFGKIPLYKL